MGNMESRKRPLNHQTTFLLPLTALACGILLENSLAPSLFTSFMWTAGGILIAAVIYFFINRISTTPVKTLRFRKFHGVWIFFLFSATGFLTASLSRDRLPSLSELNDGYVCQGEITGYETISKGDRITVSADRLTSSDGKEIYPKNLKVTLITDVVPCKEGDRISFPCQLRPQINDSTPRHIAAFLQRTGNIYCQFISNKEILISHSERITDTPKHYLKSLRDNLVIAIDKGGTSPETSALLKALLLGDRSSLLKETKETFADAGISHIIALSGLHVTIVAGLIFMLLYPLKVFGRTRLRVIIAISCIWMYIALTGFPISAVRAALMTSFLLIGVMMERKRSSLNILCASVFIILLFDPKAIGDSGLHLSVLAVASIILFAGVLNPVDRSTHPFTHKLISALLTTMTATAGTWVVIAYLFGNYPLLFLPANLLIVPLLPPYLYIAIFHILIQCAGFNITWLSRLLDTGQEYIVTTASFFGSEESGVNSIEMSPAFVIFWLSAMGIAAFFLNRQPRGS